MNIEVEISNIGLFLKNLRESKDLSQEELGKIIGKSKSFISRVENGGNNLTIKTFFDIVECGLGGKVNISIGKI